MKSRPAFLRVCDWNLSIGNLLNSSMEAQNEQFAGLSTFGG
jgi:hypothetical protein